MHFFKCVGGFFFDIVCWLWSLSKVLHFWNNKNCKSAALSYSSFSIFVKAANILTAFFFRLRIAERVSSWFLRCRENTPFRLWHNRHLPTKRNIACGVCLTHRKAQDARRCKGFWRYRSFGSGYPYILWSVRPIRAVKVSRHVFREGHTNKCGTFCGSYSASITYFVYYYTESSRSYNGQTAAFV